MILVIGATGTNGTELIEQLVKAGHSPKALVRNPEKASGLKAKGVELVQGDLDRPETLKGVFEGVEKAFLVSSVNENYQQQVTNFLQAAKHSSLKYLVKLSGMGADLAASSIIMRYHALTDQLIMDSSLDFTILRPNSFYQNMFWSVYTIKNFGLFSLPLGDAKQSFIDVRDIGAVATKLLTTDNSDYKGQIYNLTGPESLSYYEIAQIVSEAIGKEIVYKPISLAESKAGMLKFGMPEWNAASLEELYGAFASGKYADLSDDFVKLMAREPISFKQFMQDYAEAFK